MDEENEYVTIAEAELVPDETEQERAPEYAYSAEDEILLRGRDNRIGIAARRPVRTTASELSPGRAAYDCGLSMIVHAHPECEFVWSRLVVDLSSNPGAVIEDMAPIDVVSSPVEVETKVGAGLRFTTVLNVVDLELKPEMARKKTVFFPTVTASGAGFHKAYWDFKAKGDGYLHANRELRLLVTSPADTPITASFVVRARVRMNRSGRDVLLRVKDGSLDSTITLVPLPDSPPRTRRPGPRPRG
jgi:hypothetical protein